ncbi:aminotransferase class I/II-fold pyridoxal phosphate-dependent enzyme [Nisaea acidiphila]|uniref:Aminotransferase class I/II-fold pyridoxal phosphate-dependent enzyme n=1 Tax=Nisaea acidiphila TaxID=1862145 RepID=A0A9J7AUP5_9PROT|nr:aminotransferase class I/II-fold pyridoxal phosphate-dependent enzyme [Nisaea acidiphila]UUX50193.1 aminotransferase class I/II-fold pyridoxal phosphate-dependent enzyme [Nisaea acidiphila]
MKDETKCVLTPGVKEARFKSLAPAVHRASTIVFADAEEYATRGERGPDGYTYGLYGTPTTRQLEAKLQALSGAARTLLVPSGQASNAVAAMALLSAGDHILIADTSYPPMRTHADDDLKRFGVGVDYYDPLSLDDLKRRIRPETKLVWCESPGSTTMEVQDIPAIVEIAHAAGALVGCDNTWATALAFKAHAFGVDIVSEALTKYASGHSDILMGAMSFADEEVALKVRAFMGRTGIGVSPDDAALVLRGMETMALRFAHAEAGARRLIGRLQAHPAIAEVYWPPLESNPGHALWKRDFTGAAGVFTVVLADGKSAGLDGALGALRTFAIGASWGGTRSLVAPMSIGKARTVAPVVGEDLFVRFSVGLEAIEELEADIDAFLACLS